MWGLWPLYCNSRFASTVCASCSYCGLLSIQYTILGQRALILDRDPFSLRYTLSSRVRPFDLYFSFGHSPPGSRPIQSALCALISGLSIWSSRHALILKWYPFSLRIVFLSQVCLFSMQFFKSVRSHSRTVPIQFALLPLILEWDPFSLHLRSHPEFITICTLGRRTFILRWYPFNLRFVLSSWVSYFSMCLLSLRSLFELVKNFVKIFKISKNSIKMSLHPLPPKVQRERCILWTFAFDLDKRGLLLIITRLYTCW